MRPPTWVWLAVVGALIAAMVASTSPVAAQTAPGDPGGDEPVLAQNAETARIIVALEHRGAAAQVIEAAGPDAEVVRIGEIIPYVVLEVPNNSIQDIAVLPQTVSVQVDAAEFPSLAAALPVIGANQVHAGGNDGSAATVAILDTGIDADHPFFAGRIVSMYCSSSTFNASQQSLCPNGLNTDTNADIDVGVCLANGLQICRHGTHVAGIAAGSGAAPGSPGNGAAPGARIIAMQVFTLFTNSADCPLPNGGFAAQCVRTFQSDQIAALDRVAVLANSQPAWNITAANMSLGGGGFTSHCDTDPRKTAIDTLLGLGVATVISAMNDGFLNAVAVPGCISTAVTVGATNNTDVLASFTNRGPLLDVFAPGVGINSAIPGGTYASLNGTSMAAPMVAGALALMREAYPNTPIADLIAALKDSGPSITYSIGTAGTHSTRRINVSEAIAALTPTTCNGLAVTVDIGAGQTPTSGPDVILGTPGPDVINGLGGDDVICGGGGDDTIFGGPGNDTIFGEAGNDTIYGGDGDDYIDGGDGNDAIQGNAGNDYIFGGDGNDTLSGNDGNDYIDGWNGNDTIFGGTGDDTLLGWFGTDTILGGLGNDTIYGEGDDDLISGNAGNDTIDGGDGNDTIYGGDGADTIYGEAGADTILGGLGNDVIDGGDGNDLISGNQDNDTINGGAGDDTIYGVDGDDILNGGAGNDTILGGNGNDTILGGPGNDLLAGNDGLDVIDGGAGDDEIYGGNGNDTLTGGAGQDIILGGAGDDTINSQDGEVDQVSGNAGTDTCTRDPFDNVFQCEILLP